MEEELERKIFYKKDYNDVKELQKEAEAYAQSLRSKYTDTRLPYPKYSPVFSSK